jgi:hypothetical protein
MTESAAWQPFEEGTSIGETGSEGGVVLRDDEYRGGARITLERDGAISPFAITCGVYGWMVHTRFFSTQAEAEREYAAMLPELATLVELVPLASELEEKQDAVIDALGRFVERFP